MATSITFTGPFQTIRVAMDGTAGNLEQVTIDKRYNKASFYFTTAAEAAEAGYIVLDGVVSDGGAKGNNWQIVPSGALVEVTLGRRLGADTVLFLAGSSNTGFCHVAVEQVL